MLMETLIEKKDVKVEDVLPYLTDSDKKELQRKRVIVQILKKSARMSLTKMSKVTGIPVSTLHDNIKKLQRFYRFTIVYDPDGVKDDRQWIRNEKIGVIKR